MSRFYCIMRKRPDGSVVDITEQVSKSVFNIDDRIVGYHKVADAMSVLASYLWALSRGNVFDERFWFKESDCEKSCQHIVDRMDLLRDVKGMICGFSRGKRINLNGGLYYVERRSDKDIESEIDARKKLSPYEDWSTFVYWDRCLESFSTLMALSMIR